MSLERIKELKTKARESLEAARNIRTAAESNGGLTQEKRNQINAAMDDVDRYMDDARHLEREMGIDSQLNNFFTSDGDADPADVAQVRSRGDVLQQGDAPQEPAEDGWDPAGEMFDGSVRENTRLHRMISSQRYNSAFYSYMRQRGIDDQGRMALGQVRTMVEGIDADGGFLAPTQLVAGIQREEFDYAELKPQFTNINTNARSLTFTKGTDGVVMGWVAELGTKPEDQVTFFRTVIVPHVGAVVVWISDELLEDEQFGLQGYIAARVGEAKVLLEEEAFISGSGSGRPFGLLTRLNAMVGTPQRDTVSVAGGMTSTILMNLIYNQPRRYRRRAEFILGNDLIRRIRLLQDTQGQFLWQPGLQAGQPDRLLGYNVRETDAAALNAGFTAGNDVAIFGDLRQYMVMNRIGLQVKRLEELRALTDEVGFRFRFRTGGDTIINEAFRTLRAVA